MDTYPIPPPPPRPAWLVPVLVVVLIGSLALAGTVAWLLVTSSGSSSDEADPAAQTGAVTQAPVAAAPTVTVPPTVTAAPQPTVTVTQTPAPTVTQTPEPTVTATPEAAGGQWYAQFGAFNVYENAVERRGQHYGSQIVPGSQVGLAVNYVVVRPTSSQAEAAQVCSNFAADACYVAHSVG
ncbi:MAG: hypothetical protein QM662_07255 [Gordonia sp. (in: high G+C Gram-positive bacteria)]